MPVCRHSLTHPSCQSGRCPPPVAAVCTGCALYGHCPSFSGWSFHVEMWDRSSSWRDCSVRWSPRKDSARVAPEHEIRRGGGARGGQWTRNPICFFQRMLFLEGKPGRERWREGIVGPLKAKPRISHLVIWAKESSSKGREVTGSFAQGALGNRGLLCLSTCRMSLWQDWSQARRGQDCL